MDCYSTSLILVLKSKKSDKLKKQSVIFLIGIQLIEHRKGGYDQARQRKQGMTEPRCLANCVFLWVNFVYNPVENKITVLLTSAH